MKLSHSRTEQWLLVLLYCCSQILQMLLIQPILHIYLETVYVSNSRLWKALSGKIYPVVIGEAFLILLILQISFFCFVIGHQEVNTGFVWIPTNQVQNTEESLPYFNDVLPLSLYLIWLWEKGTSKRAPGELNSEDLKPKVLGSWSNCNTARAEANEWNQKPFCLLSSMHDSTNSCMPIFKLSNQQGSLTITCVWD